MDLKGLRVHFVGIKGTGMCALVEIFYHAGAVISGSDVEERFYTDDILDILKIKALPFSPSNITDDIQLVVYSSAYKKDVNPDLIEAVKKNIPCKLYTEALGEYSESAYSCGICGVHGKTSTTGITGSVLKELPLPSQVLAGSVIKSFNDSCIYTSELARNAQKPEDRIFVAETCEYQRHFMSFCPQKIILTSVESDHQDYYPTYEDIRDAFVDYICLLPDNADLIYCADDKGACETVKIAYEKRPDLNLLPYGEAALGKYRIVFKGVEHEQNKFFVEGLGDFYIPMPGRHEVLDSVAALALANELLADNGLPCDTQAMQKGLASYAGAKRRSEVIGRKKNKNGVEILVMDDYGHHPTAVKTTLLGLKEFYKGRKLIVDFMSHTYSRTQALLEEFAESLSAADTVILHKIYSSARENPADFQITGRTLFEHAKKYCDDIHYYEEIMDAKDFVLSELEKPLGNEYPDGYLFVTMGAGNNWPLGLEVLR